MTKDEIRAIAQQVADEMYGTENTEMAMRFATRFLAAINAKAEPVGCNEAAEKYIEQFDADHKDTAFDDFIAGWYACCSNPAIEPAQDEKLRFALENCRLLAARHRKEDWALLILGFCAEGGVAGSPLRDGGSK